MGADFKIADPKLHYKLITEEHKNFKEYYQWENEQNKKLQLFMKEKFSDYKEGSWEYGLRFGNIRDCIDDGWNWDWTPPETVEIIFNSLKQNPPKLSEYISKYDEQHGTEVYEWDIQHYYKVVAMLEFIVQNHFAVWISY